MVSWFILTADLPNAARREGTTVLIFPCTECRSASNGTILSAIRSARHHI